MLWDATLLASWSQALGSHLGAARLRAWHAEFDARRMTLYFREATLQIRLHPKEAGLFLFDAAEPPSGARPLAARLRAVHTVDDERVVTFQFLRVRGSPAQADLTVEFIPNRHNLALTEGPDRTIRTLFRTEEGRRILRTGQPYAPPPPVAPREGRDAPVSLDRWTEVWGSAETVSDRRRALSRTFAWTSSANAGALAAAPAADGWAAWASMCAVARGEREARPVVLADPRGPQPYPVPLPGLDHSDHPSLFEAIESAADSESVAAAALLPVALVDRLATHVDSLRGRCTRIESELQGLPDPAEMRSIGDLLLARFHQVPQGARSVRLEGFDGVEVDVELDPESTPNENARRYYDRAARAERAAERLPDLAAEARRDWERAAELLARATEGTATAAEIEAALPQRVAGATTDGPALPYRRYRSSGGLEIRVGRGARSNDDLTFRHSAPTDVWLHARDVAGAHVILRWTGEGSPPARDLEEAAVLAALGSKARTSGSVPVDWTRRRYVRKPRKAPPGLVVPERVSTVFVEPDAAVEERLRVD